MISSSLSNEEIFGIILFFLKLVLRYNYKFIYDRKNSMSKVAIIGAGPCGLSIFFE